MMRDCETCVYAKPFGGENDNRCSAWSCEYINRDEAIKAYKILTGKKAYTVKADSETVSYKNGENQF